MKNFYFLMLTLFCSTLTFAQLTQDFESDPLSGWTSYTTEGDDPGFIRTDALSHSGNYSYYHDDDNIANESTSYLVSPSYTVGNGDALSVYIRQYYSASYYGYSGIVLSTASGDPIAIPSDFIEIFETGAGFAEDSWEHVEIDLSNYVGETVYIAFKYTGDFSHRYYIDDLYIGPPCTAPVATVTEVADCDNYEFSVQVALTDLGTASSVTISDNQSNTQTVSSTGNYTFGPYASGTSVQYEIKDASNEFCKTLVSATYLCPPLNDNCDTATSITTFPYTLTQNASGATQTAFVTCNNEVMNDGVWFTFEGESAEYTINLTSYEYNAAVAVFSGDCNALTCVNAVDSAAPGDEETLTFIGEVGSTYYVSVGNTNSSADLDEGSFDIEVLSQEITCASPTDLVANDITDLSVTASWTNNTENESYDLAWGASGFTPGANANAYNITGSPYTITGLTPETDYDLYVRGNCNPGLSDWVGPISFTTLADSSTLPGTDCVHPITVNTLPYNTTDDTSNYADTYSGSPGSSCGTTSNYLNGDDVVYAYTPSADTSINISLNPETTYSGIFVYENCADIGSSCIAGVGSYTSDERLIEDLAVTSGQTYYIVISTYASPQSVAYDLSITENTCTDGTYTIEVSGNCVNDEYNVDIEFTDLGTLSSYTITDDQGNPSQTINAAGTLTFGPYTNETEVSFTFEASDPNCSTTETFSYRCPNVGDNCDNPIVVSSLPYTTQDNTSNYFDDYSGSPGSSSCGTSYSYLGGDDVVYAYTPSADMSVNISLNPEATYSGIFVYENCADIGTACIAGVGDYTSDERVIEDLALTSGQTYYIVISTYPSPQTVGYELNITENTCSPIEYSIEYIANCDQEEYSVNVNVTSLGSSSSITFNDDQSSAEQTLGAAGTVTFGPYNIDTAVNLSLVTDDANCSVQEVLSYTCPATNDDCPTSVELTVGTNYEEYAIVATNIGASESGVSNANCGNANPSDVWFSAVVPASGILIAQTGSVENADNMDTVLAAYSGTCDTTLTQIGCNDDIDGVNNNRYSIIELENLTPGETIYFRAWEYGNNEGVFTISVYDDNTCTEASYTISPAGNCVNNEYEVVIEFTDLGSNSSFTISDDQGSASQTVTAIGEYTFGPYPTETEVIFSLETVDPNCSTTETFSYRCPDVGDNCYNPIIVSSLPYTTQDNTSNYFDDYSGSPGSSSCGTTSNYLNGDDVVYAYTPSADTFIDISLTPETSYSGIFVYENCADIGSACIAGVGSYDSDERLIDNLEVTGGQTYYIVISTYASPQSVAYELEITENTCIEGTYTVEVSGNCVNNEYSVDIEFTDLGTLSSYTITDNQGNPSQTINAIGTFTFGPYASETEVSFTFEANDVNCSTTETFSYRCPNVGDNCENPIVVSSLPYTTQDDTSNYFDDYSGSPGSSSCGTTSSYLNGDDVVYAYTPSVDTSINISLNPEATYSGVFVYESCADIGSSCIAGVGNYTTNERLIEDLDVTGGQTYYIVISTFPSPQSVAYELEITENTCEAAEYEIEYLADCDQEEYSVNVNVTSLGSSSSITFNDDQSSAEQTLGAAGTVTFGPYSVDTTVNLSITTDDANCSAQETLSYTCPATNDDCPTSIALTVGANYEEYAIVATNIGASESGVSNANCGNANPSDVWFSAVVPASGILIAQTGSVENADNIDTVLAAYSGTCDTTLIQIGCNDDIDGSNNNRYSKIELENLTPGETIYFRAWEYSNNEGVFTISVYDTTLGVNDFATFDKVKLYPNPTSDNLNISGIEIKDAQVYSTSGKLVKASVSNNVIDTRQLSSGTYVIRLTDIEGNVIIRKFIKK